MGEVFVTRIFGSIFIKDINNILPWSFVISRHKDKGYTFF